MTNEEITQTIQHEIQQAQQPLLERIEVLEKDLAMALDYICVLDVITGITIMEIPVSSCRAAADKMEKVLMQMPKKQKTQPVIHGLANWIEILENQADALERHLEAQRQVNQWDSMAE